MHKQGKPEALATNAAAAQTPTRQGQLDTQTPHFQPSSIFPNVRVGHAVLA